MIKCAYVVPGVEAGLIKYIVQILWTCIALELCKMEL